MDKYEIIDALLALYAGDRHPAINLINGALKDHVPLRKYSKCDTNTSWWALYHILQSYGYENDKYIMNRPNE